MPTLKVVLDGLTEAIAAGIRPGFTRIRLFVALRGQESEERYQQLVDAVNVHCPVLDIVANPVPIDREVKFA